MRRTCSRVRDDKVADCIVARIIEDRSILAESMKLYNELIRSASDWLIRCTSQPRDDASILIESKHVNAYA